MCKLFFTTIYKAFTTLIAGQEHIRPKERLYPAIKNQKLNVCRIWKNKYHNDFGIERILRLLLSLSLFIFPGLYIRHVSGKYGLLTRKIWIEIYVIFKLFLPIAFLLFHLNNHWIYACIAGYMAWETVNYLACLIFLSNEFAEPISYKRSLISIFINYIEVALNYAVIYSVCNTLINNFFKDKLISNIQLVYFSFVTTATVGYGDIYPLHWFGQLLVISQTILFFLFVSLFFNFFSANIQRPTYYTKGEDYKAKWKNRTKS
ncbi:hypothetical protein ACVW2L_003073 [Mucilaginibacter sp. HD30]